MRSCLSQAQFRGWGGCREADLGVSLRGSGGPCLPSDSRVLPETPAPTRPSDFLLSTKDGSVVTGQGRLLLPQEMEEAKHLQPCHPSSSLGLSPHGLASCLTIDLRPHHKEAQDTVCGLAQACALPVQPCVAPDSPRSLSSVSVPTAYHTSLLKPAALPQSSLKL